MLEEALKEEYDGAYEIRYVDVDANQELVDTYNVGGIPVVVIFRNGKEVLRFNGEMDYDDLCDILDRPLEKPEPAVSSVRKTRMQYIRPRPQQSHGCGCV